MTPDIVPPCTADCLFGFHNPPGEPCICIPDIPPQPPQVVPTLDTWALIGLLVMICATGLVWIWRRRWNA